jgi:hypothetical protein
MGVNLSKAIGVFIFTTIHIRRNLTVLSLSSGFSSSPFWQQGNEVVDVGVGRRRKDKLVTALFPLLNNAHDGPIAILYKLKLNQSVTTIPTGVLLPTIPISSFSFTPPLQLVSTWKPSRTRM